MHACYQDSRTSELGTVQQFSYFQYLNQSGKYNLCSTRNVDRVWHALPLSLDAVPVVDIKEFYIRNKKFFF